MKSSQVTRRRRPRLMFERGARTMDTSRGAAECAICGARHPDPVLWSDGSDGNCQPCPQYPGWGFTFTDGAFVAEGDIVELQSEDLDTLIYAFPYVRGPKGAVWSAEVILSFGELKDPEDIGNRDYQAAHRDFQDLQQAMQYAEEVARACADAALSVGFERRVEIARCRQSLVEARAALEHQTVDICEHSVRAGLAHCSVANGGGKEGN